MVSQDVTDQSLRTNHTPSGSAVLSFPLAPPPQDTSNHSTKSHSPSNVPLIPHGGVALGSDPGVFGALDPLSLSFRDIAIGKGVLPSHEVYNGTHEGFDVRAPLVSPFADVMPGHLEAGEEVEYLVTLYRPDGYPIDESSRLFGPEQRYQENNHPPEIVSIQCQQADSDGQIISDLVDVYRIPLLSDEVKRYFYAQSLERVVPLLQNGETFTEGVRVLHLLESLGIVERDTFRQQSEVFSVRDAAPAQSDLEPALAAWLSARGVDIRSWGTGEAKSLSDLAAEIVDGEGVLSYEGGIVYLENRVVAAWITDPEGAYRLYEKRQQFVDGRIRARRTLGALITEKMKLGQSVEDTLATLGKEELQLDDSLTGSISAVSRRIEPSVCFPGIQKRNIYFMMHAALAPHQMRDEFIEHTETKDTVIGWTPAPY